MFERKSKNIFSISRPGNNWVLDKEKICPECQSNKTVRISSYYNFNAKEKIRTSSIEYECMKCMAAWYIEGQKVSFDCKNEEGISLRCWRSPYTR